MHKLKWSCKEINGSAIHHETKNWGWNLRSKSIHCLACSQKEASDSNLEELYSDNVTVWKFIVSHLVSEYIEIMIFCCVLASYFRDWIAGNLMIILLLLVPSLPLSDLDHDEHEGKGGRGHQGNYLRFLRAQLSSWELLGCNGPFPARNSTCNYKVLIGWFLWSAIYP